MNQSPHNCPKIHHPHRRRHTPSWLGLFRYAMFRIPLSRDVARSAFALDRARCALAITDIQLDFLEPTASARPRQPRRRSAQPSAGRTTTVMITRCWRNNALSRFGISQSGGARNRCPERNLRVGRQGRTLIAALASNVGESAARRSQDCARQLANEQNHL